MIIVAFHETFHMERDTVRRLGQSSLGGIEECGWLEDEA